MYKLRKVFKPEIFQGKGKKKTYFEGWYYKFTNADANFSYALIPGISIGKNKDESHSFIQIIDGINGHTYVIVFDFDEFEYDEKSLLVNIGGNIFTKDSIKLNIKNQDIEMQGELKFERIVEYPTSILSPGIMGFFSYFPFMECNHGVVSLSHETKGIIRINDKKVNMNNGLGYIEKDWGTSFPSGWIWVQGNDFENQKASFMLSVANIPFLGFEFIGFLGFLYANNRIFRFGTYNFSAIKKMELNGQDLSVIIKKGKYMFTINATQAKAGLLKAPKNGTMTALIEESINAEIQVTLDYKDKILFEGKSVLCGMEISDKIDILLNKLQSNNQQ